MSQRPGSAKPGSLALLGVAFAAALLLVLWVAGHGPFRDAGPSGPAALPDAVAPPAAGVEPPPIRLLPPDAPPRTPRTRPQGQLADWASSLSEDLDIPEPALEAYGYAAAALEVTRPRCGLSWSVLAGIGAVESRHGRYGGAVLDETARPSIPIRGIPLDGRDGVQLIRDTDNGTLDGDRVYDRAVGPLQFIPTTWQRWARDADGDGVADPDDLDDAAMAAAYYLCDSGRNLRDPQQFWDALLEYNASREYVQQVLNHADYYGRKSHRARAESE